MRPGPWAAAPNATRAAVAAGVRAMPHQSGDPDSRLSEHDLRTVSTAPFHRPRAISWHPISVVSSPCVSIPPAMLYRNYARSSHGGAAILPEHLPGPGRPYRGSCARSRMRVVRQRRFHRQPRLAWTGVVRATLLFSTRMRLHATRLLNRIVIFAYENFPVHDQRHRGSNRTRVPGRTSPESVQPLGSDPVSQRCPPPTIAT